jgi:hypothetical protein
LTRQLTRIEGQLSTVLSTPHSVPVNGTPLPPHSAIPVAVQRKRGCSTFDYSGTLNDLPCLHKIRNSPARINPAEVSSSLVSFHGMTIRSEGPSNERGLRTSGSHSNSRR